MAKWKMYTPEGMQDILPWECYPKRVIEERLRSLFRSFAYYEAETPAVEFLDVFSAEPGLTPQETMFKSFDEQGRILVLRPDITIPVVRMAATKFRDLPEPYKIFYIGNMYRFDEHGGGRQKEFTQAGAELLGADTPEADAEIISIAANAMLAAGLKEFQIDIGQVGFFKGLMHEAGLQGDEIEKYRQLVDRKDIIGIEELAENRKIREDIKKLLTKLPVSFGSPEAVADFRSKAPNSICREALDNISEVIGILEDYGLGKYISIDLGMVSSLKYYSGIIFKGFTYGIGYPLLSGGRYDGLSEIFGVKRPATGFSMGINMLMSAMSRQKIGLAKPLTEYLVWYDRNDPEARRLAFAKAETLRREGFTTEVCISGKNIGDACIYASSKGIGEVLEIKADGTFSKHAARK
ncbi:MAG: ATP phosphoribosyltransferase regulatory subunit [Eubacteriales bacterium]|nr:ATP phosphoribosyltransferase regulatory subunit [Eubacteriales bacterium]